MKLLALVALLACSHAAPRAPGLPYGDVYCSRPCTPGPAGARFLAELARTLMPATLADCCKEAR